MSVAPIYSGKHWSCPRFYIFANMSDSKLGLTPMAVPDHVARGYSARVQTAVLVPDPPGGAKQQRLPELRVLPAL